MRQIRLVGERYLSNTVSTLDVLGKKMNEDQDEIPRERAVPTKEELEAIRRTDRAILENTRGGAPSRIDISMSDAKLLLAYLQRDVNLFLCPDTGAIIFRGVKLFWRPEETK